MTRLPDGSHVCDGCGGEVGNGGIGVAMSLVDYHDDAQRHRHLCYRRADGAIDENGDPIPGCRDRLLGELA